MAGSTSLLQRFHARGTCLQTTSEWDGGVVSATLLADEGREVYKKSMHALHAALMCHDTCIKFRMLSKVAP
jgi:hypothetical protein